MVVSLADLVGIPMLHLNRDFYRIPTVIFNYVVN
jgi:hypothetical protein